MSSALFSGLSGPSQPRRASLDAIVQLVNPSRSHEGVVLPTQAG